MKNKNETFETWNKIADLYQEKFMSLNIYNESYDYLLSYLKSNQIKILDVGCGPANISFYLKTKRPYLQVTGVDIAPNMLSLAQKNIPDGHFIVLDARKIVDLTEKFDLLLAGFCAPYFSQVELEHFIKDCSVLLFNEGLLYVSFVAAENYQKEKKSSAHGSVVFYYHEKNKVLEFCRKQQLTLLTSFEVPFSRGESMTENHTIFIFQKL